MKRDIFRRLRITAGLSAVALVTGLATPSKAVDLEVTHWWTSGGEAAAVKVFADAYNALGGDTWVDGAIAGSGGTARPIIISRITGGDPMGATQLNHGRQAEDLVAAGLMLDLTDLAEEEGWRDFVRPVSLLDACTIDGRIYCVPVNIHSAQWMWTSPPAFEKAGIAPPKNWNEFVTAAPALKAAGITPLAVGQQPWQNTLMFGVLVVGLGGTDLWKAINIDKNLEVARGPQMAAIWQAYADARALSEGSNVNQWNEATNMVITARAGAQIMGDWAQGEFSVAGQTAGNEYDCLPGLGLQTVLDTGGDAFYFPKTDDPDIARAQRKMASMMISKSVQVDFNLAKGSLPVRGDINLSAANACMKKGLEILKNPNNILPSGDMVFSADTQGQFNDLLVEFWSDTDMTAEEGHEAYVDIIASAD
ncbi:MAG: ABC transporter substrate-binding protein [Pseudomonadota bacterium]